MLTFSVGDRRMALPAALIGEIAPLPRITRVPHAPDALMGVANVRGAVVPVLAVAKLLGQQDAAPTRIITVDMDGPIGLAVTSVSQVVDERDAADLPRLDIAALLAEAVPERQARRSGGGIVAAPESRSGETEAVPLVTFLVSGQHFALPLSSVEEVLRLPDEIARLPHADGAVIGTVALAGAILPLLSLPALLALPVAPFDRHSRIVVVWIGTHRIGLAVDAMRAIVRVAEADIDPVPQALNRGGGETRIQAICRMEHGARLLSVLAPDQLLREDITARLLQGDLGEERTMADDRTDEADARFLLFRIGEESFGLPIDAVEEVAPLPSRLTPLPKAPDFVQGVMNVRGKVIPVIDQSRRFNGTPVAGAKPRVIVVRIGELTAGFIVDAVSEVVRIPASALGDAPDLGTEGTRIFEHVAHIAGQDALVLIVSPRQLLDRAEQDMLASLGRKGAAKKP